MATPTAAAQAPAQPTPPPAAASAPPAGQQAALELGRTTFPINEYFTIAIRLSGAPLEKYSAFPDIEGFKKSGKTSTTTTRTSQGRSAVELVLTQRYAAFAEGDFTLKPFSITVNGQVLRSAGAALHVVPQPTAPATTPPTAATPNAQAPPATAPSSKQPLQGIGLLDQLLGKPKPQELIEQPDQAFLSVEPNKTTAWVGEPVHVGMYLYLAPTDQGLLDFHRFAEQLPTLLRQLRQPGAWEETFDETNIRPDSVRVGGKPFLRYQLHEAVYYPLSTKPLSFPVIGLQMIKYRLAKRPLPGTDSRVVGYKTYFSRPRTVQVKALPAPPAGIAAAPVAVGRYSLREGLDRTKFQTGQTVSYTLVVEGEGNLTALTPPAVQALAGLEVYGPEIRQEVTRANGRVTGRKILRYRLVPSQPGQLNLGDILAVPTFDYAKGKYNTLRSDLTLQVSGPAVSPPQEVTAFVRTDPFYQQQLAKASSTLQALDTPKQVRRYANFVLAVLLVVAVFGWWTARDRP
ncbi:BatD family protein [Solirubrum puertoriconensis]|uniref:BatD family protein n=1 Tax=Solirubrum puertoriconensis TaxID=1751427 RepID=UPI00073EACD9|nr:BatD family protein [Solirubrum puertoriconensis]